MTIWTGLSFYGIIAGLIVIQIPLWYFIYKETKKLRRIRQLKLEELEYRKKQRDNKNDN